MRPTKQRLAVVEAMASFDDFRSAQEIHDLLGRRGEPVGLATVYRTLQRLADAGEVDMLRTEDGEAAAQMQETFEGPDARGGMLRTYAAVAEGPGRA